MKSLRLISSRGALAAWFIAGLGGCAHLTPTAQTSARIHERKAAFTTLTPQQQQDILGGAIERGNTPDVVYMALGKPSRIVTSADGVNAMWVYVEYYSPMAAASTAFNNPNSTRYTPQLAQSNTPPLHFDHVPSFNAPGHLEGPPAWLGPADFHSTNSAQPVQSLDVPDMLSKTVYVFFHAGRVAEIKLDGDSSGQHPARPNAATGKKS